MLIMHPFIRIFLQGEAVSPLPITAHQTCRFQGLYRLVRQPVVAQRHQALLLQLSMAVRPETIDLGHGGRRRRRENVDSKQCRVLSRVFRRPVGFIDGARFQNRAANARRQPRRRPLLWACGGGGG